MNGYSAEDRQTCSQINNIIHMVTSAIKRTKPRNVIGRAWRAGGDFRWCGQIGTLPTVIA